MSAAKLTLLYDDACALCVRCRTWIESQRAYVPIEFLSCRSQAARERYGEVPWLAQELVVVSDEGDVWAGAAAFIVALWALEDWREWSYRMSGPLLAPLAERFFHAISSRRSAIAAVLTKDPCESGTCRVDHVRDAYRPQVYR